MFQSYAFQSYAFQCVGVATPIPPNVNDGGGGFYLKKCKPDLRVEKETEERLHFDKVISEIYDRIEGVVPELQQEIAEIVTHKKAKGDTHLPPLPMLDVEAIMQDMQSVKRLIEIHRKMMFEEEMIILMLAL